MLNINRILIILINVETLAPRDANWPSKLDGILFSAWRPIQGHKV
jgi:hypothetical protein